MKTTLKDEPSVELIRLLPLNPPFNIKSSAPPSMPKPRAALLKIVRFTFKALKKVC